MKRFYYKPYFFLLFCLLFILSLPADFTQRVRSAVIRTFSPSWRALHSCKISLAAVVPPSFSKLARDPQNFEALEKENMFLRQQIHAIQQWIVQEDYLTSLVDRFKTIDPASKSDGTRPFWERRKKELAAFFTAGTEAVYGKVIFREPASWSSSLWLSVGEKNNKELGKKIIAKNSPVVKGQAIVGVVEHVGWKQCRVRLLTDAHLVPSVRAVRGTEQNRFLQEHLKALLTALQDQSALFTSEEEFKKILSAMLQLQEIIKRDTGEYYLAKGEVFGSSEPLWRCRGSVLQGVGFNCDFADEEGMSRDLRTGQLLGERYLGQQQIPLLRLGDILITTGLDGVFPPGYRVGIVSKILPLREGGASYSIEALPAISDLHDLADAWVLPPNSLDLLCN